MKSEYGHKRRQAIRPALFFCQQTQKRFFKPLADPQTVFCFALFLIAWQRPPNAAPIQPSGNQRHAPPNQEQREHISTAYSIFRILSHAHAVLNKTMKHTANALQTIVGALKREMKLFYSVYCIRQATVYFPPLSRLFEKIFFNVFVKLHKCAILGVLHSLGGCFCAYFLKYSKKIFSKNFGV